MPTCLPFFLLAWETKRAGAIRQNLDLRRSTPRVHPRRCPQNQCHKSKKAATELHRG